MRRLLCVLALSVLAAPVSASALTREDGDGTLSVKAATGTVSVRAQGAFIGRIDHGVVTITDPIADDGTGPIVTGEDWSRTRSDTTTVYGGAKMRFRLVGGSFRVKIHGSGIFLSVVGKGSVMLDGSSVLGTGSYSLNGDDYKPFPVGAKDFSLAAAPAG